MMLIDIKEKRVDHESLQSEIYPVSQYSKRQIVAAGKILKHRIPVFEEMQDDLSSAIDKNNMSIFDAFNIAHNWRNSHMRPMLQVRNQLAAKLRKIDCESVSAARLKRMDSIRRKMRIRPLTLYQMQDIAGCRAIVDKLDAVSDLANFYFQQSNHEIVDVDDYISSPKIDGYRSQHVILKFKGVGTDAVYDRQTVEVQLRTQAQHSWATAVEAVGLVQKTNIKGGGGAEGWRRFFELMSTEIAYGEGAAPCPTCAMDQAELRNELAAVAEELNAISVLETLNRSISRLDAASSFGSRYFLLQFDYKTQKVSVEPFISFDAGAERYVDAEENQSDLNSVLVEVGKIKDLKAAFPNYFLDVQAFKKTLVNAINRRKKIKKTSKIKRSANKFDLSWLEEWRSRRRNR